MGNFVHLHVHTEYSLLDGACRLRDLFSCVKNLGQDAVAITDHGVMYGVIDFYKLAKKNGIKPIIGCEVYVSPRKRTDKIYEYDSDNRHLVLLCKNNVGYQNLINMVSKSWTEGFYNKPRIDEELLENNSEGLIALSACLAGEIPKLLLNSQYDLAKEKALKYKKIFGEDSFYLELQDHGIKEQQLLNSLLIKLSKETDIPLVATNDCHYLNQEDSKMHDVLLCIQTNKTLEDENRFEFSSDQFYLKSEDEMKALFPMQYEAIENTKKIADMCNVEFEFGNTKLPHFEVPNGQDHFEYFRNECYKGLYKHYTDNPDKSLIDRLEYELNTINKMGYVDYYLIVNDFVSYAKSVNISVGPGRGSGAGSLAAYCIGITGIDPIKYNLIFERFLNPERVSMPDFDIDFCYERRQEVIDYVIRKYGADHVAQIVTFGTMAARGSIRDVGRVMAMPYSDVDSVAKLIPMELGMTIDKALNVSQELKSMYDTNSRVRELINTAKKIEGMPRHTSTHAAGVVITRDPVSCYVPLAKNDSSIVTQYTMTTLEELGLLKMDFLGLRNLTVLNDTKNMIKKDNPKFELSDIKEDRDVFEMFSKGDTDGVFQFESAGMKSVLMQLKPENIEDLIAVISLYRPGPMESIPMYIQNRHHPEKVTYMHPMLSKILDVTYGCIIYQEQVMQIFRTLAGYSLGRADIVRRAMSKKKADVMEKERKIFIHGLIDEDGNIEVEGCIRRGISEEIANKIFGQMESFASYAFNKSHAAAYAFISYQTAWLKCKYPKEYMAALMTSVLDNTNKVSEYILECEKIGIKVLPPSVNESDNRFTVSGENIRFGLLAIKNLGTGLINRLVYERKKSGKFKSFYDFCERMYGKDMNKRALESLIRSGALDGLDANRHQMLSSMNAILDNLDSDKKNNIEGQIGFFDIGEHTDSAKGYELPKLKEFPLPEILAMEKQVAGIYLSGHPLSEYTETFRKIKATKISDIFEYSKPEIGKIKDGDMITILAIISNVNLKTTRSNTTMAFVDIEDTSSVIEMIVFPKLLHEYSFILKEGNIVKILAKVNVREDDDPKVICEKIYPTSPTDTTLCVEASSNPVPKKSSAKQGLYIKFENNNPKIFERAKLLISIFDGNMPVYFYFSDLNKLVIAPRSLWVDINDVLVNELKNIIGNENVIFRN